MARLGGVFLASKDPERLMTWFEERFGMDIERNGDGGWCTFPAGDSVSVFGIHMAKGDHAVPPAGAAQKEPYGRQAMMVNVAVDDLEAAMEALHAAGDEVVGPEVYEGIGTFAWTRTPDGHDVELWQA